MAITKIWKIYNRLDHVVDYAKDENKTYNKNYDSRKNNLADAMNYIKADYKTEKQFYVSGINCLPEIAVQCMEDTKKAFQKEDKILCFHAVQSFAHNELTPEIAHEIGVKFAEEMWGDRFEVVVSTHLNTYCYHNHFIINSVSFKDGKKYYDNHENYALMRHISDEICKEYGLSVLEEKRCRRSNISYDNFYKKYLSKNNYYNTTKEDIDKAIKQAYSFEDFKDLLKRMDYDIYFRGTNIMSVRRPPYKRNIRIARMFGEDYSIENIKRRILEENETRIPFIENYRIRQYRTFKSNKKYKKVKLKGFRAIYFKYCYILKVYPKRNYKQKLSPAIRADVKRMEELSNEAKLLNSYKIETGQQLFDFRNNLNNELKELLTKRTNLWKVHNYKNTSNESKQKIRDEIYKINSRVKQIREEVKLCNDIETRIPKIKDNLKEFENEKNVERKEKVKNERIK